MGEPRVIAGRYTLVRRVGSGAMGTVWLARDETLHRDVAVKQVAGPEYGLGPGADTARQRAMREGRMIARLSHPNAVGIYDVVIQDGQPWLVMEYVPSRNLTEVVREDGPLPPERAAAIGAQLAGALAEAHRVGVVHRDVKPSNVLLTDSGIAKITDFGIARGGGDTLTETGLLAATPAYVAPETARGAMPAPASDVWSLAATLYHAVEGEPPFGTEGNALVVLGRVANSEVRPPRRAGPLTAVLARLMTRDPAARPTMTEAHDLLRRVADGAQHGGDEQTVHSTAVLERPSTATVPLRPLRRIGRSRPVPATPEAEHRWAPSAGAPSAGAAGAAAAGAGAAGAGAAGVAGAAAAGGPAGPAATPTPAPPASRPDSAAAHPAAGAPRRTSGAPPADRPGRPDGAAGPDAARPDAARPAGVGPAGVGPAGAGQQPAWWPAAPAGAPAAHPPGRPAGAPPGRGRRSSRAAGWLAAAVVILLLAGIGWYYLGHRVSTPGGNQGAPTPATTRTSAPATRPPTTTASPAPRTAGTTTTTAASTSPPAASRAASPMQAATMTRFVSDYYQLLPENKPAGWSRLGPDLKQIGYDSYVSFWNSIRSVSTSNLSADPAARTVTGTVVFVTTDGRRSTERHVFDMVTTPDGTGLLIDRDRMAG
jgi:eukaryotic-like serine/threonine-protein kinase